MIRTIMSHPRTRQAGALGALAAALLLAPAAQADTKVGVTAAVNPQATGKPPSSNERVLYVGIDMQADERVRTSADGRVQLLFLDGSALSIGPNSDVVIDKYVYNPDDPNDPGELAFSATRGVFRVIGGKLSKLKPVTIRTPTATLGIRGSGALIDVTKGTSVFTNGDFMTVEAGGKTVKVIRPGSAVDFGSGVPSDPYLVNSNLIKGIQGAFEKAGGLGEISPAAGPGGPGGGNTPDNKLAGTNIGNTNSGAAANALGLPPTDPGSFNKVNDVVQDAVTNSSNDTSSNSTTPPENNVTPPGPPPPPPPPVIFSYEPAFGHLARTSVSSSVTPGTPTSFPVFTPNTANYDNIAQAQVLANNTIVITMPSNETFTFPYTSGPINPSNSTVTMNGLNGTGFVVPDIFFNYLGNFAGGSFSIYGGLPTAVFPTTGFAAYDSLGSRLPFLEGSSAAAIVPFLKTDPGVYVSPMFSAFASVPISGQANPSNILPVTLQASLVIQGSGANQTSLLMGGTGVFSVLSNENDVALSGTAFGTYRSNATSFATRLFSGATSQLLTSQAGTFNAIFGDNADYIVVGPDSATVDTNVSPVTVTRNPNTLGVASPLGQGGGTGYYFQTTFTHNTATPPSDLGATRTAHLDSNATPNALSGYTAGIAEVLVTDATGTTVVSPTHTVVFESLSTPTGTVAGDGVHIQTDPTTNRLAATFNIQAQDNQTSNSLALNFGSLSGFSSASSAFIDDTRFGASESPSSTPSTFNGTPATSARLFMVSSGTLGSVTIDGVQLCACEFLKWGYWSGDVAGSNAQSQTVYSRAHLATWVAGDLPTLVDIPATGTATYNGSLVGNVVNGTSQYLAAGAFSHTWDFGTRTGALSITNFDTNKNFSGGVTVPGNGRDFTGTFTGSNAAAAGITGAYNGSFFKGGSDPVAAMAGKFTMTGSGYVAAGTFAAQK